MWYQLSSHGNKGEWNVFVCVRMSVHAQEIERGRARTQITTTRARKRERARETMLKASLLFASEFSEGFETMSSNYARVRACCARVCADVTD